MKITIENSTDNSRRILLTTGITVAASSLFPLSAMAKEWPSRPITFVAGQAPGSSNDQTARTFSDFMSPILGVPIVVENRAGGGGMIAATQVARSAPDGYTFLIVLHSQMAQASVLYKKPAIDPDKDLIPVASIGTGRGVMVSNKSFPAQNFSEMVELSRKRPITVGNYSIGSGWQLMMAEVAKRTGGNFTIINYKGTGAMIADLVGGHIDIGAGSLAGLGPLISRGDAKAMVIISGGGRTEHLPGIPTWSDVGMTGDAFTSLSESNMLFAPKGTPEAVIKRIGELWHRAVKESARVRALRDTLVADDEPLIGKEIRDYVKNTWPIYRKLSIELGLAGTL